MIKPPRLKIGDTVGIIAPSQPVGVENKEFFEKGVSFLKNEWKLNVILGKNVFNEYYDSAGTSEERAEDFNNLWKNPKVKMIIMALGGHTASHLLDKIDYDFIKNNPKIFCGISDGTTLLNPISKQTNLITFHGPDLCYTFGKQISPIIERQLKASFFGEPIELKPFIKPWKKIRGGKVSGKLIGGHSGILMELLASGYIKPNDYKNKILVLEGTDKIRTLNGQFYFLKLAGIFDQVSGIILGHFEGSNGERKNYNRPVSDVLLEITKDYDFPIIEIGELGHCVENYVFPIGCQATIDSDNLKITIDESTVL
ncbi:MAG: S66 peptidase family protein [Alphaproteobacteria bacterium]